jgi:NhaP-type Na+/H+ or K+/H+ antiporter
LPLISLKFKIMKKKLTITVIIQTILVGLFFIYAFLQKIEANKQRQIAEEVKVNALQEQQVLLEQLEKIKVELENCR